MPVPTTSSLEVPDHVGSVVELLRKRASDHPDRLLYTFVDDLETKHVRLTYGEMDRRARALGAALQRAAARGDRALLIYQPGPDYVVAFFGCLYAGLVAVPTHPPRLNRPAARLQAMVADTEAALALTSAEMLPYAGRWAEQVPGLASLRWLATDQFADESGDAWRAPRLGRGDLAYLQYTSGSTAVPRGVMISHGNLLHNSDLIRRYFQHTSDARGVMWVPPYHDLGLVGGVVQAPYVGGSCTLMSPLAFLQRPLRWLQAITRFRGTTAGAPNFAYDLCVQKITPEQRATLDLSSWDVAFNGAEPVRHDTLERFAAAFASCGFRPEAFYPCYGLAEATLIASGGLKATAPRRIEVRATALQQGRVVLAETGDRGTQTLVSCGRAPSESRAVIVSPTSSTRCLSDQVGEIWLSGPSVACGYWNQPQATRDTFQAYLADSGEGPFLRTGDLGFIRDGELFVTGRLKDLIIIDGRNHYPQDIEQTVELSHPSVRPMSTAAFSVGVQGEERLVVVAEVERRQSNELKAVVRAIRHAVAEQHDVQVYRVTLVRPGSVPKTSSGKIQRYACKEGILAGTLAALEE